MFKKGFIKLNSSIILVKLDKYGEQYLYGEAGLSFEIKDDKVICTCQWLRIDEQSLNGKIIYPIEKLKLQI